MSSPAAMVILALATAVYGLIVFAAFDQVFSRGVCCADDELMATVAKNLAWGYGYAVWTGSPGLIPFDYEISTGPVLILPAALLIRVFGNQTWVPGLTTTIVITLLFAGLALIHARRDSVVRSSAYMLLFGLIAYAFTMRYFVAWFALIGEMPAALLVVLGGTLWIGARSDRKTVAISSFVFGLAFMTKFLALLGYAPMVGWLSLIASRGRRSPAILLLGISGASFLLPVLVFEAWKLVALGPDQYIATSRSLIHYVTSQGAGGTSVAGIPLAHHLSAQLGVFAERFGASALVLIAVELCGGVFIYRLSPSKGWPLYAYFLTAALIHWTWWLFVSPPGWPRYIVIGLIYHAAALASFAYVAGALRAAAIAAVVIALYYPQPVRALGPILRAFDNRLQPDERLRHLTEAVAFLETLPPGQKFVTNSWSTAAGVEYMLPTVGNFVAFDFVAPTAAKGPLYLVRNTHFMSGVFQPKPGFSDWEGYCSKVLFDEAPFLISFCPPQELALAELTLLSMSAKPPAGGFSNASTSRLRIQGRVNLLVPVPSTLDLSIPPGKYRHLRVTFGVDVDAWQNGATDGVCFVIAGEGKGRTRSELLHECLHRVEKRGDRGDRTRLLAIGDNMSKITFTTAIGGTAAAAGAHWSRATLTRD